MVLLSATRYRLERVNRRDIRFFMEKWHYSGSINGLSCLYCFALYDDTADERFPELVGAAIFGRPAMKDQAPKWWPSNPTAVLELRRLACIDDTPKNTESFFIGQMLKWLTKHTDYEYILSLADPHYGHGGTIYQATNFERLGESSKVKVMMIGDKQWHPRSLALDKPFARTLRRKIAVGHETVRYEQRPAKVVYGYKLRRKRHRTHKVERVSSSNWSGWFHNDEDNPTDNDESTQTE